MIKRRITHDILWRGVSIRSIIFEFLVPIIISAKSYVELEAMIAQKKMSRTHHATQNERI